MTPDPAVDEFVREEPRGVLAREELLGDLRPTLVAMVAVALSGVVLGLIWALVAPGQATVTTASGASSPLAAESDHVFDATAIFFLLAAAYGVVVGVLAWRRVTRRGPVTLLGIGVATTAGGWVAAFVGTRLAGPLTDRHPIGVLLDRAEASGSAAGGAPIPATLSTVPPTIGSFWTVLAAGVGAVLAYLLCAIALGEDDMCRPEGPGPEPAP
ncbi:DUF2567 domain-containing protein [Actinomycetospora termitidis]|uniref:DUF2567 domain-containing protein n=1 Tax=Actinomycetospora termitidis TaxID=3053470 RepID=A0ABT7M8C2_9PSEU|nr:DUF2567 domain-containing protein [Actinomycetospora sp. Odt1-22]MDL5156923.1 DUF2567 domain-containing protein [Actinomycetospora sp. Odt1-22]